MQDYITGILENRDVTERYHGQPFAMEINIRSLYGSVITVEDPTAIANELQLGKRYNFILAVSGVDRVRAFTHSKTMSARFSGTIRELKWEPPTDQLMTYNEDLLQQPMSIVGTVHGHVLLSRLLLGGVVVGNAVTWGKDAFELVGVYKES